MCTVSFIPVKDHVYITSNRDEKKSRGPAIAPASYHINGQELVFPKDTAAGGSWIAMLKNGNAAVLLNGGFKKHIAEPPYRKSRGLIFLDIITTDIPVKNFTNIELDNIEPFTLIIWEDKNLFECRWDGKEKYCIPLKNYRPYIWSSSTLYNKETVKKRESWFAGFLNEHPAPGMDDILHFHQFTGDGDKYNDLYMNRDGNLQTVSVTGINLTAKESTMQHIDLISKTNHEYSLQVSTAVTLS